MKYIRTTFGKIFNLLDLIQLNKAQGLDENEIKFWNSAYRQPENHKLGLERRILKQADTIEELCDEFVLYGNRPIVISQAKKVTITKGRMTGKIDIIVYGAVWTSKGLIYVAKLNRKGEWELL